MTDIKNNTKRIAQSMILLSIIGIASSFAFILTALASGIVPADVIALANSARSKIGLSALAENAKLSEAAKNKADDMLKNDYFAHTSPKGIEPWYWMKQAGYRYQAAGENLAINYTDAKEQHDAWMKSATHRANIMNTRYREIGVAVVKGKIDGKESIVTVEFFGTPLSAVADQAVPVPPGTLPAPAEIKGVETVPPQEAAPALTGEVPIAPLSPVVSDADISWEMLTLLSLLALSLISAPGTLIFRAWRELWGKHLEAPSVAEIPVVAPIDIDSIHHKLPAH